MTNIELSEDQRKALEHDTTEVTQDELKELIERRGDEWKKTPTGQQIIARLAKKSVAQADASDTTQKALEAEKAKTAKLQLELDSAKKWNESNTKKVKDDRDQMRAEWYTDLYILSRFISNGVFSAEKLETNSKFLKGIFGWNIIPVYNAMAYLSGKSAEWNGKGKDFLVEKLSNEEKYAKMLKQMIEWTHTHLQGTPLVTEVARLRWVDDTIRILGEIRVELEKDPKDMDHKKISAQFQEYLRLSGQYIKIDDTARTIIKSDLERKKADLATRVSTAQSAEEAAKNALKTLEDHNKQTQIGIRARERELANLNIPLTPAETKYKAKWASEAVLTLQSHVDWWFKDDTQKAALIADAKIDPGKYIPNPDTHPNIRALHSTYEAAKGLYDSKTQEIETLKNSIHTTDDIANKQAELEEAKKKHTELKAENAQKWPRYNSLLDLIGKIDATTDVTVKARLQAEFSKEYATANPTRLTWATAAATAMYDEINKIKKWNPTGAVVPTVTPAQRTAAVDKAIASEKDKKKPIDATRSSLSLEEKANAEKLITYIDSIHDKITEVNRIAQEKVAALGTDPKIQSGDEFYKAANTILNDANDTIKKYNDAVMKQYGDATRQLTPLWKADLDKMLISSVKAEKLMAVNSWMDKKVMDRTVTKGYFGGMMLLALGSSALQVGKWIKNNDARAIGEWTVNLVDTGIWFIPVVWGFYDIWTSAIFAAKGYLSWAGAPTDWNGKKMTGAELATRVWFGVLWVIPYVGTLAKASKAAKLAEWSITATEAVRWVQKWDKASEWAQLVLKVWAWGMIAMEAVSIVHSVGKWWYDLAIQDKPISITDSIMDKAKSVVWK